MASKIARISLMIWCRSLGANGGHSCLQSCGQVVRGIAAVPPTQHQPIITAQQVLVSGWNSQGK